MYIKRLGADDIGRPAEAIGSESPSWDDVKKAIERLDGRQRTSVFLGLSDVSDNHMAVGGGKDGVYVCSIYYSDGREFQLADPQVPSNRGGPDVWVLHGEPTMYGARHCVGLEPVLRAAEAYAARGERCAGLTWDEV
jgi:hypothetical protein